MSIVEREIQTRTFAKFASNACLTALSPSAFALLKPHLSELIIDAGAMLWDPTARSEQTYFPVSGMISILLPLKSGESIEVGNIARQGAAAPSFEFDSADRATAGQALIGGRFVKIATAQLLAAAERHDEIKRMICVCRDWLLGQAQQIAACNTVHSAERRLCRWLFQCCQRMETKMLHATQEQIASLLGIRRTTVTLMAQGLHSQGLIDYRRGKISVLDADKLRVGACECCDMLDQRHWPSTRMAAR